MFPLAGKEFPQDSESLALSIRDALGQVLELPRGKSGEKNVVTVAGGKFPQIKKLAITLDGAGVNLDNPPPRPRPTGKRQDGIHVDQFEVSAHPIKYQDSKLNLDLKAKGVRLDYAREKGGRPLLVLTDADEGHVKAKISRKDIEELLLQLAIVAAEQQGVKVKELDLGLESEGPRSIALDARIKAKKMGISGVIHVKGRLDIDDQLNAIFSELECEGEGMVGTLAAKLIQPRMKEYQGRKIPLVAFSLGDLRLHDVKISLKDSLQVEASFGSNRRA